MGWKDVEPAKDKEREVDRGIEGADEEKEKRIRVEHCEISDQRIGKPTEVFHDWQRQHGKAQNFCT